MPVCQQSYLPHTQSLNDVTSKESSVLPVYLPNKPNKQLELTRCVYNNPQREMAIRHEAMHPGQEISGDQYICQTPGRLACTFGKENTALQCHGGTTFVDHYSGFVFIGNQVPLQASKTAATKRAFDRFARDHGVKLQHFRLDNLPFDCDEFKDDLADQGQTVDFSGAGAYHQNGVADHAQGTTMTWTCAQMMHQLLHWPDQADESLWPYTLKKPHTSGTICQIILAASLHMRSLQAQSNRTAPIHYFQHEFGVAWPLYLIRHFKMVTSYQSLRSVHNVEFIWGNHQLTPIPLDAS